MLGCLLDGLLIFLACQPAGLRVLAFLPVTLKAFQPAGLTACCPASVLDFQPASLLTCHRAGMVACWSASLAGLSHSCTTKRIAGFLKRTIIL
jgi:hypothetical protein